MSEKRLTANRQNARKSTGPRTKAGKARSKLNAIKHGAYSRVCLEGEDIRRLKMLHLDLLAYYNPVGFEENLVIQEIAVTLWRKNRFMVAEGLALNSYAFFKVGQSEEKADIGFAMAQDSAAYGTVPRCLASEDLLDRRLWGLFDRLRKIQKRRGFYAWKALAGMDRPHSSEIKDVLSSVESPMAISNADKPSGLPGQSQADAATAA